MISSLEANNNNQPGVQSECHSPKSKRWRIQTYKTYSNWAWDIKSLKFFMSSNLTNLLNPISAFSSGSADNKYYSADGAIIGSNSNAIWGGRPCTLMSADGSSSLEFYLGACFSELVSVVSVHFIEPNEKHSSVDGQIMLQYQCDVSGAWANARLITADERSDILGVGIVRTGPAPPLHELVTPPSRPLRGEVHGCCYKDRIHNGEQVLSSLRSDDSDGIVGQDSEVIFTPDPFFYLYENCEGLFVCVSHACGMETLHKACVLVRSLIPEHYRRLWGRFRSPKWAKDGGPMRIIVLDNRTGERSGIIPELNDSSASRNCVNCPFIFTSREDLFQGVNGWMRFQLTTHEITHGADMVIRQLVDPAFDEIIEDLFQKYRYLLCYHTVTGAMRTTYAATNRDEFLAEVVAICRGCHEQTKDYQNCSLNSLEAIREKMPDLLSVIEQYFIV